MELELALGRPTATMSEREFRRWRTFTSYRPLPQRRLEFYLAQIALLLARSAGSDASLSDFLFEFEPPEAPSAETAKAFFKFNPRKKVTHG